MKSTLYFFISLIVLVFALFPELEAQVITPFTPVYQVTQKGGIVYLANTSLGCSSNPALSTVNATCAAGSTVAAPGGTMRDNDFISAYIDIDGDPTTFMSSSDSLNLPQCSEITKAYLFWGASGATTSSITTCRMKVGTGSYQTVTAISSQTNNVGFNTYHSYADVTSILQTGGIRSRVTVANIGSASLGTSNTFGSWCIAVVFKNDLRTMRQLTIFRGLANISGSASTVNVPISGFLTPLAGPVTMEVGLYVHDGDRGSTGDGLRFKGAASFVSITDAVNPVSDVMNSTVSYNGTLTPFRIPNMGNTNGLDADIFIPNNSSKNYIGNAATSATFQMTTGGETYLPQMVTTALDVYEPDLRASIVSRDVNGGSLVPGDIVEYRIKGINIGSDPADNSFITDTLDIRANYIPNSTRVVFGAVTGTMTDASGDDLVDYNPLNRTLKIRIGTGANSVIGGTIMNSPAGADSTIVTYSVMCTSSCVKIACSPSLEARAFIWGTGLTSNNVFSNGSNPGIFDTFGCPIPGTTSSPITSTNCAIAQASNSGPGCTSAPVIFTSPPDTDASYLWSGPGSFSSALQNPTIAAVTSTMAGLYTVTLAITGSSCNAVLSTSLTVGVCTPTAVNDFSNTVVNTPISGEVDLNDLNLSSPVFSISSQPSNGTLNLNSATGQYTFTPSANFTGVTSATYAVCNTTFCSSAQITFTVFPALIANPDQISTIPTQSVTSSLLTNDAGATGTLNATYSVTASPLSPATGTLLLNTTTGQYTFNPNSNFTGSTQITYTVCNTVVNPTVCSSSSLTLNVYPLPVAANDFTRTTINTSLTANAGSNDTGLSGANFSISTQPANGTIVINPATGQYTFTPVVNFTGVTTSTYQLCNNSLGACSSAVISVTVYPNLIANPDIISTTPTSSVQGNLVNNDLGISTALAANYSVTLGSIAPANGTLALNSTTGQYTFQPNPSFTGSLVTSYTICNTSVTSPQCAVTTVTILVYPVPQPVNDQSTTVVNIPVTGNAAANDSGTLQAIYSLQTQGTGGTVAINSSTGQYTFTPVTGFTGISTMTYQMCNGAGINCSTALITVSVYPALAANSDTILTLPNTGTSGNLSTNDAGILSNGILTGTYAYTLTALNPTVGVISFTTATGQYSFTPAFGFSGSTSTTYTVCNNSLNPAICSTASIVVIVGVTPIAQADAGRTMINTPLTGSVGINDSGALNTMSPNFVSSQPLPGTGTLSMNPVTGVYNFTPATGFTGTTSATYTLCNIISPPCSTAQITFSVYPALVANPDAINTVPGSSVTGNVLNNDAGILTSGTLTSTYSVAVTQPAPGTGTIVINPASGQYTFLPNPVFTGTAITSYTVCTTSVNPAVCSNATIALNVLPLPAPMNDFTTSIVNGTVIANASANDSGATFGTYSLITQPTGGTITMNASTGQYTFVANPGFTGVTTATYNLCNGAPVTCSSAVISVTVYPALIANPDLITTTPSVTATGALVNNDAGVVTGGVYSVSATALNAGTGTLTVNPSTGQYTYVPNPSFTGTTATTYTICNTSLNPVICSSASIMIQVGNLPVAVSDFTTTMLNTVVTGSAGTNDGGVITALNPAFTISQPTNGTGTVSINSSTGVYSYTPASGFTGTTSCTYTLCNTLSPPCSTAAITFSVYPAVVTNSDIVSTLPAVVKTGSLASNDLGILLSGTMTATYQFSITQTASATGTFVINPANGQYTFTPNASFTGSAQTTYTACNTSVNPSVCSSTTVVIYVYPNPVPANDFTNTVSGGVVSGSAGANDSGTTSAVFSIVNQPTGGTLTINASTGVYSFTAGNAFTGVTTATYNLCNGAATTCSMAVITITVHPALVANPDVINTNPTSTVTGNLLGNDAGITSTLGATYSVTVNQPAPSTGSFVVNPSTGQYTFIPNSSFTGTVQTTYQVCNTALNPQQCSTATITINVYPDPVPADDFTTTVINTPVVGNAASNDIGTSGGTFSITGQPVNGTVTMNASNGQFTFTPAPGFTGVTTATYNLCNGAPVTCSTAVLSVTVYPALIATNDVIQTSSTLTVNGSLLTNDLGIVSGAVYSVTGSPVAAANGTMLINPATGQYTFIPNPAFSGSISTTYTVCNLSVNPIICSTATIVLFVGDMPIAADDAAVTIIDTPVSGNVAVNDGNLTNAVFTFGTPGTGTLSGNSSTGQFTFTPAAGFTGTTSATYTLCNIVSPPCATATIVFTVYPALLAVNDQTITNLNTPVSGSLTANDLGLVSGGNYSVSVSPAPAGTGSVQVNPLTGQYTFTPATGYTGTVVINYSVCQINPSQCSSASLTIVVGAKSAIGLSKVLSKTEYNNDGTLSQTYKVVVKNLGNQPLSDIAISDDLTATYPLPSTFTVQSITADPGASTQLSVNAAFTGVNSNSVLTVPATSSLTVGRTDTIVFTVKVSPNGYTGTYNNTASVTAIGSGTLVSDGSANGLNPDPDNDGDPENNNGPTTFTFSIVKIGIAKAVSGVENVGNGCHNITFKFTIKNFGTAPVYNVTALDNLDNTFGSSATYSVISGPLSVNKLLLPNANFTGSGSNINMIAGSSSLAAGATDTILLKVKYCVKSPATFSNVAQVSASSLPNGGFTGGGVSNNGLNPEQGGPEVPTVFTPAGDFFIPQGFSPNNDGVNDVLKIRGIENYPTNEFSIINRWGNVVYKKNGYDNTWDGTANTGINYGTDLLPEGTYFYILDLGDGSKALKGYIYLNRSSR